MADVADRRRQFLDALDVDRDRRQPFEDHGSGSRLIQSPDPKRVPVSPADMRPWAGIHSAEKNT